ncbi:hypothetical protein STCF118_0066 [Salmonella phage ST-118]|nr:hypothetical protein STCF118_0066 [Salmonella phage ST-118]
MGRGGAMRPGVAIGGAFMCGYSNNMKKDLTHAAYINYI